MKLANLIGDSFLAALIRVMNLQANVTIKHLKLKNIVFLDKIHTM